MLDKWKTQTCRYCNCLKKHKSCGNPEHHKLPVGEQLTVFPCSLGIGFKDSESGGIELAYTPNAELTGRDTGELKSKSVASERSG